MNSAIASGVELPRAGTGSLSLTDKFVTLLIFLYWLLYENIFFFYAEDFGGPVFLLLTNALKLLLPVFLLIFTGLPGPKMLSRPHISIYFMFFVAFLLWSAVPTVISGDVAEWLKMLPRILYFPAVLAWFTRRPETFLFFVKLMMVYVLSALAQYLLIYATGAYDTATLNNYGYMAGPYGLFGNITSRFYLLNAPVPFLRLAGFWNEPTHASACAFASFFLGRYLVSVGESNSWRIASHVCLISGVLTLSLAGYLALGCALLFGLLFGGKQWTMWRAIRSAFLFPLAAILILIVGFGRTYVADNYPDNIWLRALVGARDTNIQQESFDPTSGRLNVAANAVDQAASTVIGVGIQITGDNGVPAPESAPLYWLMLAGFPGLLFILGREAALMLHAMRLSRNAPQAVPVVQALIAVMAQQLSYGTWMTPVYFVLAAMVLLLSADGRRGLVSRSFDDR